jgi:hypothetical protein
VQRIYNTDSANATAKPSPMPYLRIATLERIIVDRYGERRLPDDDEGHDILRPMADHLAQVDPIRIRPWVAAWKPGLPAADIDDLIASRNAGASGVIESDLVGERVGIPVQSTLAAFGYQRRGVGPSARSTATRPSVRNAGRSSAPLQPAPNVPQPAPRPGHSRSPRPSHGSRTDTRHAAHGNGTASARVSQIRGQQLLLPLLCRSRVCDTTIAIGDRGGAKRSPCRR